MRQGRCPRHGPTADARTLYEKAERTLRRKAVLCKRCDAIWVLDGERKAWVLCEAEGTTLPFMDPRKIGVPIIKVAQV